MKSKLLYLGNYQSTHGGQPSVMESLIDLLNEKYHVSFGSDKKNHVYRFFHFLYLALRNGVSSKIVIIDVYSSKYFYAVVLISQLLS